MNIFEGIFEKIDQKRQLKIIEREAYSHQREIQSEEDFEVAARAAHERGIEKAKTPTAERIVQSLKDRRETVSMNRRDCKSSRMDGMIAATSSKKDMSSMISSKGEASKLVSPRKDVSELLFGK